MLKRDTCVEYASLIYNYIDSTQFYFTNEFVVMPKESTSSTKIEELCVRYNVKIIKKLDYVQNMYLLKIQTNNLSVAKISTLFYETGLFEFAEPNLTRIQKKSVANSSNIVPTAKEWHLRKTQIDQAWSKTAGASTIKIAVIDDGVELSHSDLSGKLVSGYDCFGSTAGGSAYPSSHGTSCAGLIVANANSTCGTGVAYGCKVIPVRISVQDWDPYALTFYSKWASDMEVATAIRWAFGQNGQADILSCSWGGGPYASIIDHAFRDAVNTGRGGMGCLVFCSSGNENKGTVSFPSSLPQVISVGATTENDKRATPNDWGEDQGSNWGNDLDIVAPGNKIYTIDIGNSCTSDFGGTSAAAPIAAGVMGLILSKNPYIPGSVARYMIESTCDKISGYEFNGMKESGTWNSEVGYGRINALKALTADVPVNPPTSGCAVANFIQSNYYGNTCSVVPSGKSINFISTSTTNASGGSITQYLWQFGDGTTSGEKNPVHTYTNEGTYSVSLKIHVEHSTGSCENIRTKNKSVIVSQQLSDNITQNSSWIAEDDTRSFAYIGDNQANCSDDVWGTFVFDPSKYGTFDNTLEDCTDGFYPFCTYKINVLDQYGNYNWEPINKCVPGEWFASHGAPRYAGGFNSNGSSAGRSIQMIAGRGRKVVKEPNYSNIILEDHILNEGEGIYYSLGQSLNPSQVYKLKFTTKSISETDVYGLVTPPDIADKINIALTNGLQPQEYGASNKRVPPLYQLPSYPFTQYKVGNVNTAIDQYWRCVEIYFIPPADGNLNQLWIYPEGSALPIPNDLDHIYTRPDGKWVHAGHYQDDVQIDELFLSTLGNNCISEIVYSNNTNLPAVTSVSNQIIAQNNVEVLSGQDVRFEAGNRIHLKEGFHANYGSTFNAVIKECVADYNYEDFIRLASTNNFSSNKDNTGLQNQDLKPRIHYPKADIPLEPEWELRHDNDESTEAEQKEDPESEVKYNASKILIYPSPSDGKFTVDLNEIDEAKTIEITNTEGELIFRENVNQRKQIDCDLSGYPLGLYIVAVVAGTEVFTMKQIKN